MLKAAEDLLNRADSVAGEALLADKSVHRARKVLDRAREDVENENLCAAHDAIRFDLEAKIESLTNRLGDERRDRERQEAELLRRLSAASGGGGGAFERAELIKREEEVDNLKAERTLLKSELEALRRVPERPELVVVEEEPAFSIPPSNYDSEKLTRQVKQLNNQILKLKSEISRLEAEVDAARMAVAAESNRASSLKKELDRRILEETDSKSLRAQVATLKGRLEHRANLLAEKSDFFRRVEMENSALRSRLARVVAPENTQVLVRDAPPPARANRSRMSSRLPRDSPRLVFRVVNRLDAFFLTLGKRARNDSGLRICAVLYVFSTSVATIVWLLK